MKGNCVNLLIGCIPLFLLLTSCTSSIDNPAGLKESKTEEVQNIPDNLLITANATQLVLESSDVRPGWVRGTNRMIDERNAQSACRVSFQFNVRGQRLNMNNQVAIYPDVNIAKEAYKKMVYQDDSVENCDIGDECFLDVSTTKNTFLLFRENNVTVQLWLSEDRFDEVIPYANIIEKRMNDYIQIQNGTSEAN